MPVILVTVNLSPVFPKSLKRRRKKMKANKTKVAKKQMKMNLRMYVELYEQLWSKRRMLKRGREGKLCQPGHKIRARPTILETNLESH